MISFLDLPTEIILCSLWFLDLADIHACQHAHLALDAIIKDSMILKYLGALEAAGMKDNRLCPIGNMHERLRMLHDGEDAWTASQIDFSRNVSLSNYLEITELYGLDGGMYFLGDEEDYLLNYFTLPTTVSEEIRWNRINAGDYITRVSLAIYEHDLIAVITQTDQWKFNILFFEASTGNRHPLAQKSKIPISDPTGDIRIAGNHLAFITHDYASEIGHIEVYEWKMGVLKTKIQTSASPREDLLFLSSQVLLVSNIKDNTLEFWDIPELPTAVPRTCPSGALALPSMKDCYSITSISIHCEPFFGLGNHYSTLPLHASAAGAITVIKFVVQHSDRTLVPRLRFSMFVHHQSLLDLYLTFPTPTPTPMGPPVGVNVIPWDEWGPASTRLLDEDSEYPRSYTANASRRYAFPSKNRGIIVLDFNPARIQHLLKAAFPEDISRCAVITNESILDHASFEKPITSKLPYIRCVFQNTGAFDEVTIDNEWLIGCRYNRITNEVLDLKFFHIGQGTSVTKLEPVNRQ